PGARRLSTGCRHVLPAGRAGAPPRPAIRAPAQRAWSPGHSAGNTGLLAFPAASARVGGWAADVAPGGGSPAPGRRDPGAPGGYTGRSGPGGTVIGRELDGRYRIFSKLGEGAMGEVYLVEHLGLGRKE